MKSNRWFVSKFVLVAALLGAVLIFQPLFGQSASTGTTTPTNATGTLDLNQILQALGGLGGISQLTGNGGISTNGITTGTTTPTTSQPSTGTGGTRVPAVITNQFTTVTGAALQTRRPGNFVQQGIAMHEGKITLPGTGEVETPGFLLDTAQKISEAIIQQLQGALTAVNTGISALSGANFTSTGTTTTSPTTPTTITNPATTGAGTSTPIE